MSTNMSGADSKQTLSNVYSLIAELWCSPPEDDVQRQEIKSDAEEMARRLVSIDKESAQLLSRFLQENTISDTDYIDLFELEPQCSLYLGSHSYEEPQTCANAAVSDRNGYMIELSGIYKHFGQMPNGLELPDYLPLMLEFLSMTVDSDDDPVREKLLTEYLLPFLPPMRARLEELETPYLYLLDALEKIVRVETKSQSLIDVVNI
ncbi:MAG: nitrate reductase molybdenum cofactor assembly chaperone [Pseudomonadales bacterium]|nr:nitrate reductase molybdenum cofactor assembly chaperone [Pseudomonadales bacterium]MDP7357096.1 nitrate reductase molybdenum cofactor assembly chaperone [Pseudomonadales bacterium]MDP7594560.1 nitrate reductase molybdenum cofactor assembly chaperone [Pseudomonadales bacterium]